MSAALAFKADPSHSSAVQTEDLDANEAACCFETTPNCELIVSVALVAISALASANFALGAGVGLCFTAVVLAADKVVRWTFSQPSVGEMVSPEMNATIQTHPGIICLGALVESAVVIGAMHLSTWAFSLILPEIVIGVFGAQVALAALVAVVAVAVIHSVISMCAWNCEATDRWDNCSAGLTTIESVVQKCVLGFVAMRFGFATAIGHAAGAFTIANFKIQLTQQCAAQPADAEV